MRRLVRLLLLTSLGLLIVGTPGAGAVKKSIWGPYEFHDGHENCPGPLSTSGSGLDSDGDGVIDLIDQCPSVPGPPENDGCPEPPSEECSAFPVYRELGVDTYQFQLRWERVAASRPRNPRNPADPAYHWPRFADFIVEQARRHGIGLAVLVQRTPSWANGGRSGIWAPSKAKTFADFMFAASRRYPSIRKWMIWGEPSRRSNFMPNGSRRGPRRYAKLLDAAFGALKRARRSNVVIGGMTLNGGDVKPRRWLRNMRLPNGLPPRMNWYGHNPFEWRKPKLSRKPRRGSRGLSDVDTLWREVKAAYARRGKRNRVRKRSHRPRKLWLSEWSVQSDHGSFIWPFYVSRAKQADWVRAGYRLARRARYVSGLGWYRLDDYPESSTSPNWGLMTYEGERKPAFSAFKSAP